MKARRVWSELEGYRIIAALCIVAFHIRQNMQVRTSSFVAGSLHPRDIYPYQNVHWFESFMANVDLFVDFFFAMSGFLLVLPFARAVINATPRPSVRTFAVGRLLRVVPLYWAVVLVVWTTRNFGYPAEWRDLLEHLTFTQWLDSRRIFYTIGPAWSLADEMWFYISVPLVAIGVGYVARRFATRSQRALAYLTPLALLVVASIGWKLAVLHLWHIRGDRWSFYFGVPARLDTFCIGAIAGVVVVWAGDWRFPRGSALALRVGTVAGFLWFASHRIADLGAWNNYVHTVTACFVGVLLVVIGLSEPGLAHRICDNRFVLYSGALTYALYIGHEGLLDPLSNLGLLRMPFHDMALNWAVGIPLALLLALLLHAIVEEPATRLRMIYTRDWKHREYYPDLVGEPPPVVEAPPPPARMPERVLVSK